MIIDTHCHLDHSDYYDDLDEVINNAQKKGIKQIIIPGASLEDLPRAIEISQKYDMVYFAVGVHPYDIKSFDLDILKQYITHPKCVAVGECGLDYYRLSGTIEENNAEKAIQKEIFIKQIKLSIEFKKPLIIHIRDASLDSLHILQEYASSELGGVLHCYNADSQLLVLAKKNFYFGIGGVLTFKNARKLVEVLPKIPLEKIILETDAPYLTPHPHRGSRNEPAYTKIVCEKVAELLNLTPREVAQLTSTNAKKLFNI
ncbi:MAG: TatD family hydrolase [Arcobacteraceae bacterium]|nr:TatD family hydrolase [Arcobacteraceae bacterium]MDY0365382.1 TatD family hydrolase [Arcobacteraceae bacterium]